MHLWRCIFSFSMVIFEDVYLLFLWSSMKKWSYKITNHYGEYEYVLTLPLVSEPRGNGGNFPFWGATKEEKFLFNLSRILQLIHTATITSNYQILNSPSATSGGCKLLNRFIMRSCSSGGKIKDKRDQYCIRTKQCKYKPHQIPQII